jgi:hypothetical protein
MFCGVLSGAWLCFMGSYTSHAAGLMACSGAHTHSCAAVEV